MSARRDAVANFLNPILTTITKNPPSSSVDKPSFYPHNLSYSNWCKFLQANLFAFIKKLPLSVSFLHQQYCFLFFSLKIVKNTLCDNILCLGIIEESRTTLKHNHNSHLCNIINIRAYSFF